MLLPQRPKRCCKTRVPRRATFPDDQFHGFTAALTFREGSHTFTGCMSLKTVHDITFDLPGVSHESLEWLRGVLAMNIAHRLERSGGMPVPTNYPVFIAEGPRECPRGQNRV